MAIVHVRLDVDSDVHPELYAMLSAIDRAASRVERMKQLASSGLIWEHLRVQGPVQAQVDIELGADQAVEPAPAAPPPPAPTVVEDTASPAKRAPRPRAGPARNLPVLYDSVELGEVDGRQRAAAEENATEALETSADAAPPPPAQKTGPRPRLMRMKEKGLFNNG